MGVAGATVLGLICAVIQYERIPFLRQITAMYIELSRNTPFLVQLFFLYYGLPKIGIQTDPKICGIAAVVSTVFAVTACGSKADDSSSKAEKSDTVYRTLQEIKEDGTINIGVFSDKNPFGYVDENGTYQGYDVYFANRIGEDLGVDVNFVSTEAANLCNR